MVASLELVARNRGHRISIIDKLYLALGWGYGHGACHVVFFFVSLLSLTTGEGTFYAESCPQMSIFLVSALHSLAFGMVLVAIMVVALEGYHTSSRWHVLYAPAMHLLCALVVGAAASSCARRRGCAERMDAALFCHRCCCHCGCCLRLPLERAAAAAAAEGLAVSLCRAESLLPAALALQTLANFRRGGCVVVVPILLALGLFNVSYAARLAWQKGTTLTLAQSSHLRPL
jgi:hypothetical protein